MIAEETGEWVEWAVRRSGSYRVEGWLEAREAKTEDGSTRTRSTFGRPSAKRAWDCRRGQTGYNRRRRGRRATMPAMERKRSGEARMQIMERRTDFVGASCSRSWRFALPTR